VAKRLEVAISDGVQPFNQGGFAVTVCTQTSFEFPVVNRRRVQASFTGGDVSNDGGLLLLRQADRRLQLTATLAKRFPDPRDPTKVIHPLVTLLRHRLYGLCQGYEDLNDHDRLRTDVALQTAVEQDEDLASASTLCRWENGADRQAAWLVHPWWIEQFIASHLCYGFQEVERLCSG
jgi:hypothetical protein